MITAPQLFEMGQSLGKTVWDDKAVSCSNDEKQIIRWIMLLHNGGKPFDLDPCYSIGRFWQGLPEPHFRFDIEPQTDDCRQADVRNLPLDNDAVRSCMFDPPFVCGKSPVETGVIRARFSSFKNPKEMNEFYSAALKELSRVASKLLVVKCQDTVSGGKQYLSHVYITDEATRLGWYCDDVFVLWRENVLWSPNMENQYHARKNHVYFLVFKK
jgi:hypothetical protein